MPTPPCTASTCRIGATLIPVQVISDGLCTALGVRLLQGEHSGGSTAAAAALSRCGAGAFAAEVEDLAAKLGAVAAVSEAVHGDVFAALAGGAQAL
jgi:hypothetical protein